MTICGIIDLPVTLIGIVAPVIITSWIAFKIRYMKNKFLLALVLILTLTIFIIGFIALEWALGFGCTGSDLELI